MGESSEESLIEGSPCQSPVTKKLKKIINRARCRRKPIETVKCKGTELFEPVVEVNKDVTQYNSKQPTRSGSSDLAPECSAKNTLTEINTNKSLENEESEKSNKICRRILEQPEQLVEDNKGDVTQCNSKQTTQSGNKSLQNEESEKSNKICRGILNQPEQLVEDNKDVIQYNSKQPTQSSDLALECSANNTLITEININTSLENEKSEKCNRICRGITEPIQKPVSKNSHSLYVFYTIAEILAFTPNNFPKNGCVQLIGTFQFLQRTNSYVLCSYEKCYMQSHEVKLDTRELYLKPCCEDMIILFGVISFDDNTPIIIAKFFQKCAVPYQMYVDLMLRLRTTVPEENFIKICVTDDDLRCDETVEEARGEEYNYEEELLNDLTQKLSGASFENSELTDSKLGAFLDDISFENL